MRFSFSSINSHLQLLRSKPIKEAFSRTSSPSLVFNPKVAIQANKPIFIRSQLRNLIAADVDKPSFEKPRHVVKTVPGKAQSIGPVRIIRSIGSSELRYFDPIVFMDWFSMKKGEAFPDHPHRGFEIVTYMVEGASSHEDFAGHKGSIKSGDVQWMTTGRGVVHSEWPSGEGDNVGILLWINLSSKNKMMEPRYQEIESKDMSKAEKDGVEIKIIAGESFGVKSPIFTVTPLMFLDFTLQPGMQVHQSVPESFNTCAYVLEGEGVFGEPNAAPTASHHAAVLSSGNGVSAWNKSNNPLRFFLIGGEPSNEPMVQRGNFVMSSEDEIRQAKEDYRNFTNGFEKAKYWKSSRMK